MKNINFIKWQTLPVINMYMTIWRIEEMVKVFKRKEFKEKRFPSLTIWIDPQTEEMYLVNFTEEINILKELIAEGFEVPEELPCTFLDNVKYNTKEMVSMIEKDNERITEEEANKKMWNAIFSEVKRLK